MSLKYKSEHMNVETAYGIIDVYTSATGISDSEITSFIMADTDVCNVKQRINGLVAAEYNIGV